MSTYWVTFRLAYENVGGKSYEERYKALTDTIVASSTKYWPEPTSFYALESAIDIDVLAGKLKAKIAPTKDVVLIRYMDHKEARICGTVNDADIFTLMPYLKKV
jgi:hypothetical protein